MIRVWSGLSFKISYIECCLISSRGDITYLDDLHIIVIKTDLILLDTKLVCITMLMAFLVHCELFDFTIFFLNILPDDVAPSSF